MPGLPRRRTLCSAKNPRVLLQPAPSRFFARNNAKACGGCHAPDALQLHFGNDQLGVMAAESFGRAFAEHRPVVGGELAKMPEAPVERGGGDR